MHISGASYEDNDHVALARDLELIADLHLRVCPLSDVVVAVETGDFRDVEGCVAITFDDGSDFDFHDLPHPTWGVQRGMFGILQDAARSGQHPTLEATTFTIVSPDARQELDRKEMIGKRWWNDDWWPAAERSGLLRVENHSWDHNNASLDATQTTATRGTFRITEQAEADAEIRVASEYLCVARGRPGPVLFAYPYGDASDYLATEYFPRGSAAHGVRAAFTTEGVAVTPGADLWRLPRYMCGHHWKSQDELKRILDDCR
ncbi:hypothetical protein DSM104443_00511 [Usitatibacter rugosus]|uniref:NodB homology domain-containing protein n=1 Tax=Usitatibacter rugosus TaxID=2732067 RepID=A0A6M4GV16_9PROT|nr:polysaccharide deacetylase family protein [Usitatibacter rugosus]QJR09467.1 hypothetical protein DSM104443_00511 [Usitatibacter rugosus]